MKSCRISSISHRSSRAQNWGFHFWGILEEEVWEQTRHTLRTKGFQEHFRAVRRL